MEKTSLSFEDYLNTDISDVIYKDHKYNLSNKTVNIIVTSPFDVEDDTNNLISLEAGDRLIITGLRPDFYEMKYNEITVYQHYKIVDKNTVLSKQIEGNWREVLQCLK
jgi:hypothetical protein